MKDPSVWLSLDGILDVIGGTTARLLIPALTFGKVRVDKFLSDETGFNWLGLKRQPDGKFLLASETAGYLGLVPWVVALIVFVAVR